MPAPAPSPAFFVDRWSNGRARRRLLVALGLGVLTLSTLSACGGNGSGRSTSAFCERLREELPLLEGPLSSPDDVATLVQRYRALAALAPLSIEDEWNDVTALVEAAASVDLTDADSLRALNELAYATEQSARDVSAWALERCEIVLPVGGLVSGTVPPEEPSEDG